MKISNRETGDPGKLAARRGHAWLVTGLFGLGTFLFLAGGPLLPPAQAQWNYDVTLTGYPQARWKALTNYIDKPALADINQDGRPEIIGAGVFGDVYCVDGRTGQILWTYDEERSLELAVYVSPAVADLNCDNVPDVVSIAPQGKVFALDGTNGKKLWSFQAEGMVVYSPGAFDIDRNGTVEISVVDTKGNLYLLSSTGKQLWKVTGQSPFFGVPAMGLVGDRAVVIAGDRSGSLRCYDATNGNPLWSYSVSSSPEQRNAMESLGRLRERGGAPRQCSGRSNDLEPGHDGRNRRGFCCWGPPRLRRVGRSFFHIPFGSHSRQLVGWQDDLDQEVQGSSSGVFLCQTRQAARSRNPERPACPGGRRRRLKARRDSGDPRSQQLCLLFGRVGRQDNLELRNQKPAQ